MKTWLLSLLVVLAWASPVRAQQEVDATALFLGTTGTVCKGTAGGAPSSPSTCDFYFNTTDGKLYMRWSTGAWVAAGSVSSITITVPTGLTATGCTITASGTCAISLTSGYMLPNGGGTTGTFLRRNTTPEWSTLVLPNAATASRFLVATSTNTVGEDSGGSITSNDGAGFRARVYGLTRYGLHLYPRWNGRARLDTFDTTGGTRIPIDLMGSSVYVGSSAEPAGLYVSADTTLSGNLLPDLAYTRSIGSLTKPFLTIDVAEFRARQIVTQDVISTIGGVLNIVPTSTLTADVATGDLSLTVKHNLFAVGDIVWLQKFGQFEAMRIAGAATGAAGAYIYLVERNLDGSGLNAWVKGDGVQNTGTTGDGLIEAYATSGATSGTVGPTMVGQLRTGTGYADVSPRWAIGNLNGLYGYSADTYGAAFGDNSAAWVKIDPTNGVRLGHASTTNIQIQADGTATFSGALSAATGTFAGSLSAATGTFAGSLSAASGTFAGALSAATGTFSGSLSGATGTFGSVTLNSAGVQVVLPASYDPANAYKFTPDTIAGTEYGLFAKQPDATNRYMGVLNRVSTANSAWTEISTRAQVLFGPTIDVSISMFASGITSAGTMTLTAPSSITLTTGSVSLAALVSVAEGFAANKALTFSGTISPTALAANTDNWDPTGLSTTRYIRASASAAYNLTGLAAQADGREIVLWNGGANTITLKNDTTSTAANRFLTPGAVDFALTQYKAVLLRYDGTSSRWIVVG